MHGLEVPSRKGPMVSLPIAAGSLGSTAVALVPAILGDATLCPTTITLAPRPAEEATSAFTTARRCTAKRAQPSSTPATAMEAPQVPSSVEAIRGPVCNVLGLPLPLGGPPSMPCQTRGRVRTAITNAVLESRKTVHCPARAAAVGRSEA